MHCSPRYAWILYFNLNFKVPEFDTTKVSNQIVLYQILNFSCKLIIILCSSVTLFYFMHVTYLSRSTSPALSRRYHRPLIILFRLQVYYHSIQMHISKVLKPHIDRIGVVKCYPKPRKIPRKILLYIMHVIYPRQVQNKSIFLFHRIRIQFQFKYQNPRNIS